LRKYNSVFDALYISSYSRLLSNLTFPGFCQPDAAAIFVRKQVTAMKKIVLSALLFIALGAAAQKEKTPAAKGVVYGVVTEGSTPVAPDDIAAKLVNNEYEGQVKAKVVQVCKAEGCWIKVERKDGTTMMVRAKDHAFLMPENIVGKTVLIDGSATVKETSEEMRKHYAEDAGKSKEEIAKIKGAEKDIQFAAKGVKVLD
jgi:hypothetical protein